MSESDSEASYLSYLPTELVLTILTYLPAKELMKCRQVCQRWRKIIDGQQCSESLWREYSREDFPGVYMTARINSKPGLLWFNIYRSLCLWPRLELAKVEIDEFAFATNLGQEIVDVRVLKDGILGVHRKQEIVYYDLETLAPAAARGDIAGNYLKYVETIDKIIIQNFNSHLFIVRKDIHNPCHKPDASFENIKTFLLVNEEVYYITLEEEIFIIDLRKGNLAAEYIVQIDEGIMCLGHSDRLNVLTLQRNIYSIIKDELVHICALDSSMNLLRVLNDYNLLEGLDWRVYFQWMFILKQPIPVGHWNIVTVKTYGDMVFVGTKWGVLRIYHVKNEFDLFGSEPIKQYNFMKRQICPILSDFSPIVQIDVMEVENGHMVIAAMPKKIAVLTYTHNFKQLSSVAMLPYTGSEPKVIKIDQCIDI